MPYWMDPSSMLGSDAVICDSYDENEDEGEGVDVDVDGEGEGFGGGVDSV